MKLFKRHGFWHVEFQGAKGRQRVSTGVKATEPERAAETAAAERLRKIFSGDPRATPQEQRKVGRVFNLAEALERTYLTRWKDTRSDVQLKYVVRSMERSIGHWLLADIDYNKLEQYQQDCLKSGSARATVNRRMSLLKVTLKHAHQKADILQIPAFPETLAEQNVRERYLTDEEEARVLDWLKQKSMAEMYTPGSDGQWAYMRALAIFLMDTGCRLGEALRLRKCDGKVVHLEHGTTKSMKARVVPLTPRAAESAKIMLASSWQGKVEDDWVGHRWGLVRRECQIEDVNVHILRHTCASRLLARGVDLYTVSKWLGHSSVKVTERYAHLQQGALEQAAAALAGRPIGVAPHVDATHGTQPLQKWK